MSNTDSTTSGLGSALRRGSVSLLLFSFVLCGALVCSKVFLLPRYTRVEVDGKFRDVESLRAHHVSLQASILESEQERDVLIFPVHDDLYQSLVKEKHLQPDSVELLKRVQNIADQFTNNGTRRVFLNSLEVHGSDRSVVLNGDVRNAGPRSMTLLAQFVEALRALPVVQELSNPQFKRQVNADGSYKSPFTISIILRS